MPLGFQTLPGYYFYWQVSADNSTKADFQNILSTYTLKISILKKPQIKQPKIDITHPYVFF